MSVELTKEVRDEILLDLRKTRAPSRTAKNTGYTITLVLQVAEEESQPRLIREEKYGGLGYPAVQKYTVARKKAWEEWDNTDTGIAHARFDYEAGTHTMSTGRDGDWLILYSIPNKKIDPKPGYFLPENM